MSSTSLKFNTSIPGRLVCTYAEGIYCGDGSVPASLLHQIPTARAIQTILSTEVVLSTRALTSFISNTTQNSTDIVSTTGAAEQQGHHLTRGDRIGVIVGGVMAVNGCIGIALVVLYRWRRRVRSSKRESRGYPKAELDSRPFEPSLAEIDDHRNVPELGSTTFNELPEENGANSPRELEVESVVHEIG